MPLRIFALGIMILSNVTFSNGTHRILSFSIMTLSLTVPRIVTISIMALRIMTLVTLTFTNSL